MDLPNNYGEKFRPRAVEKSRLPRSGRDELISRYLEPLNDGRRVDGLPELTPGRIVHELRVVPQSRWYALLVECERARSFSRYFWAALKRYKHDAATP